MSFRVPFVDPGDEWSQPCRLTLIAGKDIVDDLAGVGCGRWVGDCCVPAVAGCFVCCLVDELPSGPVDDGTLIEDLGTRDAEFYQPLFDGTWHVVCCRGRCDGRRRCRLQPRRHPAVSVLR
ncbi:MAG TPA: hypothetical protein VFQ44_08965 [Streptosporangiaceae bacterium]|nr:hypothetical protein [Streptosporangiaceae bacterium]